MAACETSFGGSSSATDDEQMPHVLNYLHMQG